MRNLWVECQIDPKDRTNRVYRTGPFLQAVGHPVLSGADYIQFIAEIPHVVSVAFMGSYTFVEVSHESNWHNGVHFHVVERQAACMGATLDQIQLWEQVLGDNLEAA